MSLAISFKLYNTFVCCSFLFDNCTILMGILLLVGNYLLASLAGTCVVLGALSACRESETMTDSAIAADIHKTLDVHLDGRTELAFNLVLRINLSTDLGNLIIAPVPNLY